MSSSKFRVQRCKWGNRNKNFTNTKFFNVVRVILTKINQAKDYALNKKILRYLQCSLQNKNVI